MNQLFRENEEIVSFTSLKDLRTKIDYYLKCDDERKQIANSGHLRAINDHTYELRLQLLLDTVFSGKAGFLVPDIVISTS